MVRAKRKGNLMKENLQNLMKNTREGIPNIN